MESSSLLFLDNSEIARWTLSGAVPTIKMADTLYPERNGSVLLTSLGEAFGEVLRKDIDRELQQE